MHIYCILEKVSYKPTLCDSLETCTMKEFLSGKAFEHASFLLDYNGTEIAVSQWVSPKRTRSYPYARVYNTMNKSKRVTIIPFLKDEGKDGDRDFIQWDTVSFMSLLGVYVIIGYYNKAEKSEREKQKDKHKITSQEFDYKYLKKKLDELDAFKSDALHWNLAQLENLKEVAKKARQSYLKISEQTAVELHNVKGVDRRIELLKKKAEVFKTFSRELAASAQNREFQTVQPKESTIQQKAKISIKNYLGGEYHLTVDELIIEKDSLFLIEKKHSKHSDMPSMEDIKDGFLKMILFSNLSQVHISGKKFKHFPVLGLTSEKYCGRLDNCSGENQDEKIQKIFNEGTVNGILVFLMNDSDKKGQEQILERYLKKKSKMMREKIL